MCRVATNTCRRDDAQYNHGNNGTNSDVCHLQEVLIKVRHLYQYGCVDVSSDGHKETEKKQ